MTPHPSAPFALVAIGVLVVAGLYALIVRAVEWWKTKRCPTCRRVIADGQGLAEYECDCDRLARRLDRIEDDLHALCLRIEDLEKRHGVVPDAETQRVFRDLKRRAGWS